MDQSADLRAVLRLDRDRIAPVAHCDDRLLQVFLIQRALDDVVQLFLDAFGGDPKLSADARELGGRVVEDLVLGQDAVDGSAFSCLMLYLSELVLSRGE